MKSTKALVFGLLVAFGGGTSADHGASPATMIIRKAPGLLPNVPATSAQAMLAYRAGWKAAKPGSRAGLHVHYCVAPFITVTGPQKPKGGGPNASPGEWTVPFDVALVDANGNRLFGPVTAVPPSIPVGSTRVLVPPPGWCDEVQGATTPPELYLDVEGRRARVIFNSPPPQASPR